MERWACYPKKDLEKVLHVQMLSAIDVLSQALLKCGRRAIANTVVLYYYAHTSGFLIGFFDDPDERRRDVAFREIRTNEWANFHDLNCVMYQSL